MIVFRREKPARGDGKKLPKCYANTYWSLSLVKT